MRDDDLDLRNATYRVFVEWGRAPSVGEAAAAAGLGRPEAEQGWRRLHDAHALVLAPDSMELLMANPFSAVPTPFRVRAAGRDWFGNCAWDAIGICAALGVDGHIDTTCPDCHDPISFEVVEGEVPDRSLVFHCAVPARRWWDDIVHT